MANEVKSFSWLTAGIFLLGCLFQASPSSLHWPFTVSYPYELISRIGEALIISAVLAVTVELYTKKRMMRDIVLDVYQYVAGHSLPEQLKDRIKRLVCTDLVRKDLRLRYDFETEAGGDRLTVTVESEFKLENLSASEIPFQQRLEAEAHDSPRVLSMSCVSSEAGMSYEFDSVETKPNESDPREVTAVGKKIKIRPNKERPGITYVIKGKFQYSFPLDYSDVFSSLWPTVGTTVVEVGQIPDDLEVVISDFRVRHVSKHRWEFREAFTRTEHFRIRWYRRRELSNLHSSHLNGGRQPLN